MNGLNEGVAPLELIRHFVLYDYNGFAPTERMLKQKR